MIPVNINDLAFDDSFEQLIKRVYAHGYTIFVQQPRNLKHKITKCYVVPQHNDQPVIEMVYNPTPKAQRFGRSLSLQVEYDSKQQPFGSIQMQHNVIDVQDHDKALEYIAEYIQEARTMPNNIQRLIGSISHYRHLGITELFDPTTIGPADIARFGFDPEHFAYHQHWLSTEWTAYDEARDELQPSPSEVSMQHHGIEATLTISEIDGAALLILDTTDLPADTTVRIMVNDNIVFDQDPEQDA